MRAILRYLMLLLLGGIAVMNAAAQIAACPLRPTPGSPVMNPFDLYSQGGTLSVNMSVQASVGTDGIQHYCYVYLNNGQAVEAPTLRLNPGDQLILNLTNKMGAAMGPQRKTRALSPFSPMAGMHDMTMMASPSSAADDCSGNPMTPTSTNVHFHGLNIPPTCHQDDVINTLIPPGSAPFQYNTQIPANDEGGLYWYHPHPHGFTSPQVNGGAAGALIIEGNNPLVQGLPERVLVVRQQFSTNVGDEGPSQLTLNLQPAIYPNAPSPIIYVKPGQQEYWRVLNATGETFLALQLLFGDAPQQLEVLEQDGIPLQTPIYTSTVEIPPAGRAEFITPALPAGQTGTFLTNGYDSGPLGDPQPYQILASVEPSQQAIGASINTHHAPAPAVIPRFSGLRGKPAATKRLIYFSEQGVGTNGPFQFYVTVDGQKPHIYRTSDAPAIVTHVGAIEDWTIENRSGEAHAFHMHQIHFLVEAINGVPVDNPYLLDTVTVPHWKGTGPYPSVTLRMDFSDPNIAGTFLFHCHILDHEDGGMMQRIVVLPSGG